MEKATLKKEGKGWRLTLLEGKSLVITWSQIPSDWDGKEVEVLREKGIPVKLVCDGKEISKQIQVTPVANRNQADNREFRPEIRAFSPYNFIPLNDKVVHGLAVPDLSIYHKGRFNGTLDLAITTKTPVFIRGKDENFLLIHGRPILPGSSLRGLIRSLVEIVSFGKFIQFNDRNLYHRIRGSNAANGRRIGFLNSTDDHYFIYEAKTGESRSSGRKEFQYEFYKSGADDMVGIYSGEMARGNNFQIPYATTGHMFPVSNKVVKSYEDDDTRNSGGEMSNLVEQVKDRNSAFRRKFEDYAKRNSSKFLGIPVWFELENVNNIEVVKHFGHCRNYRVPYPLAIGHDNHIPSSLKADSTIDFAESIFGTTEFAGRVFFDDAFTVMDDVFETADAVQPCILSAPKPTSYQHYLEQYSRGLKDWASSDARIRGYKLYWNRNTPTENKPHSWVEYHKAITKSHPPKIRPIKRGVVFHSRIRFENLSVEELGCLLFALDLPENCCHKIGMGKPLGLGTVHITPELNLIEREKRYRTILNEDGSWNTGKSEAKEFSINFFKEEFANLVGKNGLNRSYSKTRAAESLWNEDRLKLLRQMLYFDQVKMQSEKWLNETRYMSIDKKEFVNRPILPDPDEVAGYGGLV